MTNPSWTQRLAGTLSKVSPKSNLAQFREEFAEILRSTPNQGKNESGDLLLGVRHLIEGWVAEEEKCPCCAVREWTRFYEQASERLPLIVLLAVAKKIPQMKAGSGDWQPFFFGCRRRQVIQALFDRRFVPKSTLQSWIADKLSDAYSLPVLDLAIDNDAVPDYRALWSGCLKWGRRPDGLRPQEEILAICYGHEVGGSLDSELCSFLNDKPDSRGAFFKSALQFPSLYIRLSELLASGGKARRSGDAGLVNDFVKVCGEAVQQPSGEMPRASLALASLRLFLIAKASEESKNGPHNAVAEVASVNLASSALTRIEEDTSSQYGACFSLLSAVELHDIVHSHLRSLTAASADSSAPSGRSSQYERHLGKKEVLDKVIHALSQSTDGESLRDELEVAVFNVGVRSLGSAGETATFDSRLHQAEQSAILPGDQIEIVEPGRCLGKGDDALVLSKAIVRLKN